MNYELWLSKPRRWLPAWVFITALLIFWARRPDILLQAQFWGEDGAVWFTEAWNDGVLQALFKPHTGYFQTISRLTLGAATLLPLELAPLFSNVVALLIRGALIAFLTTYRMSWAPLSGRLLVALYLTLMPLAEVHANITNTHWYLGMYLVMIMVAESRQTITWRIHDILVVLIAGLSGPFAILAAPVVAVRLWIERKGEWKENWPVYLCWLITAAVQAGAILLLGQQDRVASQTGLGATLPLFLQIIGSHLVVGSIVPNGWISQFAALSVWMAAISFGAMLALVYAWVKAPWQLRASMLFGLAVLSAALVSPVQSITDAQWLSFLGGLGERYFVIPRVVFIASIIFALTQIRPLWLRISAQAAFGLILCAVLPFSLRIEPLPDLNWSGSVRQYELSAPGTIVTMPTPPGGGWAAHIIRRAAGI